MSIIFNSIQFQEYQDKEVSSLHTQSENHYTEQIIEDPSFNSPLVCWNCSAEGDTSDINAYISNGSANYEILGEKETFSFVETPPIGSNWVAIPNPAFPHGPSSNFTDSEGLKVYHEFDDQDANQNPSVHWDRNITTPVDMSDYVIKSASIQVVVNATVDQDVDCPGDTTANDGGAPLNQQESYDYVRFYVLVSDLPKDKEYEMAYLQPTDLGQGNPPGDDTLSNQYLIPYPEDDLIYFLTSVLSTDYFNFTITLGIRIYTADNYDVYDNDEFHELLIKSVNLTVTYEKKIDKFTSVSWRQIGNKIEDLSEYEIEITDANLNFKYKIDNIWPSSLSPNSEIRILVNDIRISEPIKLIDTNITGLFQEAKIGGFDIISLISKEENVTIEVQLYILDEFIFNKIITISIDDVFLEISYIEFIPEEDMAMLVLGLFIAVLLVIIGILGSLSVRSYVFLPHRQKMKSYLLLRTQKFKDIRNLEAIIVLHKPSGLPLYSQSYSSFMKGKKTLFSGFIQAVSIIGEELTRSDRKEEKMKKPKDKIDFHKVVELDLKQFYCIVLDVEELRTVLILKSKSSKRLKQILVHFSFIVYIKISELIKNWNHDLKPFDAIIQPLTNEYFDIYYKDPFKVNIQETELQNSKKKFKLSKLEIQIMNQIFLILKEKSHFKLMDILERVSVKTEDQIINALETLIEFKLIKPIK